MTNKRDERQVVMLAVRVTVDLLVCGWLVSALNRMRVKLSLGNKVFVLIIR